MKTAIVREYRLARDTYSKIWQQAAPDHRSTLHLTAAELVQPFVDRERRNERPPASERVHLLLLGIPWRATPAQPPEEAS